MKKWMIRGWCQRHRFHTGTSDWENLQKFFQKIVSNLFIAKLLRSQCIVFCRCHPGVSQKTFSVAVPNELKPISNCCFVHCIQIENSCLTQLPWWKKHFAFLGCQRPLLFMENSYCLSCSTRCIYFWEVDTCPAPSTKIMLLMSVSVCTKQ